MCQAAPVLCAAPRQQCTCCINVPRAFVPRTAALCGCTPDGCPVRLYPGRLPCVVVCGCARLPPTLSPLLPSAFRRSDRPSCACDSPLIHQTPLASVPYPPCAHCPAPPLATRAGAASAEYNRPESRLRSATRSTPPSLPPHCCTPLQARQPALYNSPACCLAPPVFRPPIHVECASVPSELPLEPTVVHCKNVACR